MAAHGAADGGVVASHDDAGGHGLIHDGLQVGVTCCHHEAQEGQEHQVTEVVPQEAGKFEQSHGSRFPQ